MAILNKRHDAAAGSHKPANTKKQLVLSPRATTRRTKRLAKQLALGTATLPRSTAVPTTPRRRASATDAPPASDRNDTEIEVTPAETQSTETAETTTEESVPMEVDTAPTQQQQQQDQQQSEETPMQTSTQPTAEEQPEEHSQPVYTLAEQKMLDTINSVSQRIDVLARELPTIVGRIRNHIARLTLYHWRPSAAWTFNPESLNRSQKQLHYSAGMVDENVLHQIFRLDSIQTENSDIRKLRKATVGKGNETIKESVILRERIAKWKRWLPEYVAPAADQPAPAPTPAPMEVTNTPAPSSPAPTPKASAKEVAMKDVESEEESEIEEDQEEQEEDEQVQQQPAAPTRSASPPKPALPSKVASPVQPNRQQPMPAVAPKRTPSPPAAQQPTLTPLQRKYAHLQLPTYSGPEFRARVHPQSGALVIEADLEGILTEDISVVPDANLRTIVVRGVRLPERRRSAPHGMDMFFGGFIQPQRLAPYGHFTKTIQLAEVDPHELLDLTGVQAAVDRRHVLQISIPRAPVKLAVRPVPSARPTTAMPQATRRAPVQHTTNVSYSDDDDEEEDVDATDLYSHPYYAAQRPQPRVQQFHPVFQQPPRRHSMHPFFGGFY